MPGPAQGPPAGLAGPAASQARHLRKVAGPVRGTPASPAAAESRQQRRPDGTGAVPPGLMQGTSAGPAAAAGPCEGERGGRLCSDAGPSSAAMATGQQQEQVARVGSGVPAAASPGAGSPAEQGMRHTSGALAAAGTSQLPGGLARLHGNGSAQPAAVPATPVQGVKRPLEQLLVSPRRRISVADRAKQLRQQEQYPGERQEAAAAEAAGLGLFTAGPSRLEAPTSPNTAAACTAAASVAHIAAQVPAVAAPAEAMPAAATPARPRVSKRKAPSEEARPATQQEPKLVAASPAAAGITPDGTPRAAVAASEKASAVEQDALPRCRQKQRHVDTAAVESGQDSHQSGQPLVTLASQPGSHAAAQAGMRFTCQPGTPQAGYGLDLPARQEQQASRRWSARASGSGHTLPAQSTQVTGNRQLSGSSKPHAPAPGTRGTTTDHDCIDLSKLSTPVPRAPQHLASDLAATDVVIDLT